MVRYENIEPREVTFDLNEFNEPLEVTGPDAWIRDIVAMIFYEPGTFADDPSAGVGINYETYDFDREAVRTVQEKLTSCCERYLTDIPIKDILVAAYPWDEMNTSVLVITVTFKYESDLISYAAYISVIDHQLRYVVNQLYAK